MARPSKNDALALLKKYGAGERLMGHLEAVHDYAMEIADRIECDRDLVETASLLHDIGRTRSHGIDHAIIGARILRAEGVDERVVRIVERHIGAGLTPEEAEKLGLPPGDYIPRTIEERIVCHTDNLIGSSGRVSIRDTIALAREKWSPGSVDRLIRMHYEVFKPDIVYIEKNALKGSHGGPEALEKFLDVQLNAFDLLYSIRMDGEKLVVSLFGRDSGKAAGYLMEKGFAARY